MKQINIYAMNSDQKCRLATVNHDIVDGSIYITLVRENEITEGYSGLLDTTGGHIKNIKQTDQVNKIIKITYHTSGIINYHNLTSTRIRSEPLFDISSKFLFIEYLVNDLNKLTYQESSENDIFIKLPQKEKSQNYSFAFSISPTKSENSISIDFYSGLFYLELNAQIVNNFNNEISMPFYYLTPNTGNYKESFSENACVLFHQKINATNDIIIYEPNKSGIYTMIYHEKRRSTPISDSLIKFKNSNFKAIFTSIQPHYAKFYVVNQINGNRIIEINNFIESITFDNRL
jgi:hypothetical protein